ncbi:MAG: DUF302 domain-containing protein [Pseudomonadota bacterium]
MTAQSPYTVEITTERFRAAIAAAGMREFAVIDHRKGAASVDLELRPTRVIVFGNPKAGTPLMQCAQTVGIDLPMKALVYADSDGQVWLSYNAPGYLAERHAIEGCEAVLTRMTNALAKFAAAAIQP